MNPLGWILLTACLVVAGVLGYLVRCGVEEARQYRRDAERDAAWDRDHGIGGAR